VHQLPNGKHRLWVGLERSDYGGVAIDAHAVLHVAWSVA